MTVSADSNNQPIHTAAHQASTPHGSIKLGAIALIACLLLSTMAPYGVAQQAQQTMQSPATGLPPAPEPNYTQPLYMRSTARDFSKSRNLFPNPIDVYRAIDVEPAHFTNSPRLGDLLKDGKIYLSLSDAVAIALENNLDIAIARYNLDIADTDILLTKSGSLFRGVSTGLVTGTLGGSSQTLATGGGPGGTSVGAGGAAAGVGGVSLTTNGAGTPPENFDPVLTGTIQLERASTPQASNFLTGTSRLTQNTDIYDFAYNQGFATGTGLSVGFNNSRVTTNNERSNYSPQFQSQFKGQVTQHLLQGFGWKVNTRFIKEAINDRRITDSSFRNQILYTVNQIENIYWSLVSAYEDVQAKERALQQSKQLTADNRKQLEIGTLAPLDVVNSDSAVASDQQALISAQSNLQYQQLIMKQAIARNLNDPAVTSAPVIPTDRVSLLATPEEKMPVDDLVRQAYANRPDVEQSILTIKNDEITLKGVKNGLLPVLDVYGFYSGNALGGTQNPNANCSPSFIVFVPCPPNSVPTISYGTVVQNLFNSTGPDKGAGFNLSIPLRNRQLQATQARSVLEYRQAQMRLEQIYTQIRMQVINGQFALTNDRAQVQASQAAREFAFQSLDAEGKKYRLGASTTANVLQQQRNLAIAENNLIAAQATYAKDRAAFSQVLANTLERYGISLNDAVVGKVGAVPVIPGLEPAAKTREPIIPAQKEQLQQQEQQQQAPPPAMPPQPK